MKIEVTVEKKQLVTFEVDATESQIDSLKSGVNPFMEETELRLLGKDADTVYDYTVYDRNGNLIAPWTVPLNV